MSNTARGEPLYWLLITAFCAVCTAVIHAVGDRPVEPLHLLLFAGGLGALAAGLIWLVAVALDHSTTWSIVLVVPYVNTLVLPMFVRLYWTRGARAPGLLLVGGVVGETLGLALMLSRPAQLLV